MKHSFYFFVLISMILSLRADQEPELGISSMHLVFSGSIRTDTIFNTHQMLNLSGNNIASIWPLQKKEGETACGSYVPDILARANSTAATVLPTFTAAASGLKIRNADIHLYTSINFAGYDFGYGVGLLTNSFAHITSGPHSALLGRTNHPLMITQCLPNMVNLELGAPITPFALCPQFRYQYTGSHFSIDACIYEQYLVSNNGPLAFPYNFNNLYSRNSSTPGVQLTGQYRRNNWFIGAAYNTQRLRPRLFTSPTITTSGTLPSVIARGEHIGTDAYTIYGLLAHRYITIAAQYIRGQNGTAWSNLGGYGVTCVNPINNIKRYAPIGFQSAWVDINLGGEDNRLQPGIYLGYTNNRGSKERLYRSPSTNQLEVYTIDGYQRYAEILLELSPQAIMSLGRLSPRVWYYQSRSLAIGAELTYFIITYSTPNDYFKPTIKRPVHSLQGIMSLQYLY
jgi:hypothetical protein